MSFPGQPSTTPVLRLDTAGVQDEFLSALKSPQEPTSSIRTRARALSQAALPATLRPSYEKPPSSPLFPSAIYAAPHGANRARDESQKLLGHLLDQLRRRPKTPSLIDSLSARDSSKSGKAARILKGVAGLAAGRREKSMNVQSEYDSDDELDTGFSPDVALDLISRLRDVLTISLAQQWQIFHDGSSGRRSSTRGSKGYDDLNQRLSSSPFRRRRRSVDTGSRSPSPSQDDESRAPELLSQCIAILHSIISQDCRFKLASPRLLRPPNSLQALSLDVALLLVHMHNESPTIVSQIGFALLPAFATFKHEMHARLLSFFEEGVLRGMLYQARQLHGLASVNGDQKEEFSGIGVMETVVSIQVEEAHDEGPLNGQDWRRWMASLPDSGRRFPSSNMPGQPLPHYYLTSLIPPLLAAITESLDLGSARLTTEHRFYRLFSMIVDLKPDAYLDLLQVVAYHTPKARRTALSLLASFWPRAVGHPTVSRPLRTLTYAEALSASEQPGTKARHPLSHPYAHQFIPWRFLPPSKPALFEGQSLQDCGSCSTPINGFGLFCPFCLCSVHFDCYDYPDGNLLAQYATESDPDTQKLAVHRFCHILPARRSSPPVINTTSGHSFRTINIFNLALCFMCRQPLWGCVAQGMKCEACHHFVHASCISSPSSPIPQCKSTPLESAHMTISWSTLKSSFRDHYRDFFLSGVDIHQRSYEEVSVCSDTLWMQAEIFDNGVALGSIVIDGEDAPHLGAANGEFAEFELHHLLDDYQAAFYSNNLNVSPSLAEYFQENRLSSSQHSILYDWPTLIFVTSSIKTSHESFRMTTGDSYDLLGAQPATSDPGDTPNHPYEVLSLAHLRDALGIGFQLHSEHVARLMLNHTYHSGLYDTLDMRQLLFSEDPKPQNTSCIFPLPLGLDMSVDVETLGSAVEACLADIDLATNEAGFLLLVRRFWPNEMATGYALRRLTKALISWVLSEAENSATILRDYVAFGISLPGVRTAGDTNPWPSSDSRAIHSTVANNGGDYVAHRRTLLKKYASGWLLALHDQDVAFYAQTMYELVIELVDDSEALRRVSFETPSESKLEERAIVLADRTLRSFVRLNQASLVFTAFGDLFLRWLESTDVICTSSKPIASLQRLLNREGGLSQRFSSANNLTATVVDAASLTSVDPWGIVTRTASRDQDGLRKSLQWLCLFARSGVEIPVSIFRQFASLTSSFELSLHDTTAFMKAALSSMWMKSLGRQELLGVISSLHVRLCPDILISISEHTSYTETATFIRSSLACCLLLAGCERQVLSGLGLVRDEEVRDLPSRRTINSRGTMASDPISLHSGFVDALGKYVKADDGDINIFIARFLHLFMSQCALLEPYEVDNFILRNAIVLCSSAWSIYELQSHELSSVRPSVLLRCLVVDPQPFETILSATFSPDIPWQTRLQSLKRLFRIILDVTNPAFGIEERQWRSSVSHVFAHYFTAMWEDPQEEIRVAVETWSRTLLPAHLEVISSCWNESLSKAPISERVKLVAFLIQLQPHFASWKVLTWSVIVEALFEEDYIQQNGESGDGPASAHPSMYGLSSRDVTTSELTVDSDVMALHDSLILLSLKMMAAGISIDLFSLLKIKKHLVQISGFSNVSTIPSATGQMFYIAFEGLKVTPDHVWPCVDELLSVLDAPHSFIFGASAMTGAFSSDDSQSTLLIGSMFTDVVLAFINDSVDLFSAPYLSIKNLLECLLVIVYKHDMESKPLKHLQGSLRKAVRRMLSVVLTPVGYDLRQLALSIVQAYIKRWSNVVGGFVIESLETTAELISQLGYSSDDVLVSQAVTFMEFALVTFSENGILYALSKRRKAGDTIAVLRFVTDPKARTSSGPQIALRETLLRDAFSRIVELDVDSFKPVMGNLITYIETIFGQGYGITLIQHVCLSLTNVLRRTADWPVENFDPSPLLSIAVVMIQRNKALSRDLVLYLDTALRTLLGRFRVSKESLVRVLEMMGELFRRPKKSESATGGKQAMNQVTTAFLEVLSEGLRGKARILPPTLTAMSEALLSTASAGNADYDIEIRNWILRLAADGMQYLQIHTVDGGLMTDFDTSLAVAMLVHYGTEQNPEILHQSLVEQQSTEKPSRQPTSMRTWNVLILAALHHCSNNPGVALMTHFSWFVPTYREALTPPPAGQGLGSAASNINHCYAAIKLWLLLDRKLSSSSDDADATSARQNSVAYMVWNELWSPFVDLIAVHEPDLQTGQSTPLASATSSSIADLFLFLREFRSVIALETALQVATLNRLHVAGRPEAPSSKLARTLRDIHEPAPSIPWVTLVEHATNDVIAAERLEMLDTMQKDSGRVNVERMKRDSRVVS